MLRRIRFHDLRHTFASQFMMKGGNLYDLQKIMGHTELSMTERYAHLSPEHLANTTSILSFGETENKSYPFSNHREESEVDSNVCLLSDKSVRL